MPDPTFASPNQRTSQASDAADHQAAFPQSLQGEGEAGSDSQAATTNRADLMRLRDEVLELLATDTLSSEDEVEAAIDDFL
jgi:hypothetical protein